MSTGLAAQPGQLRLQPLDFAYGVTRNSRLACQLYTAEDLTELEMRMPAGAVNMQSR